MSDQLASLRYIAESAAEQLRVAEERERAEEILAKVRLAQSNAERCEPSIWTRADIDAFLERNGPNEVYIKVRFSTLAEYRRELTSYQIAKDNLELRLASVHADGPCQDCMAAINRENEDYPTWQVY